MKIAMPRLLITMTCAALFPALSAKAQNDTTRQRFTLKEAVEYAKRNNYSIRNSKLDEMNAKAKVKETTADGLPQVNGSLGFNKNFQLNPFYFNLDFSQFSAGSFPLYQELHNNGVISDNLYNSLTNPTPATPSITRAGAPVTGTANITASQQLFDGSYLVALKASKEYVKLSEQATAKSATETEAGVSKAYYLALVLNEGIQLAESNMQQLEKTLNELRALNKNGFVEKIDVDRVELSYSNVKLQRDKLINQRKAALILLKMQMGYDVGNPIELTDKLENLYTVSDAGINPSVSYSSRIEYQMLSQQTHLNEINLKRWKAGYLPTISAVYSYSQNSFRDESFKPLTSAGWYSSSFVGVSLNVPLFDGFRKQAFIQQSKITLKKLENDRKNLENAISMEASNAQSNYLTAIEQLETQKKNMALAESIYQVSTAKYKQGVGSSLELTTAETERKNAQTNYLTSVYDLLVAKIELNKALGKNILN